MDLFDIVDKMHINPDTLLNQSVNIRANFETGITQSVAFILNGKITRAWTENDAPYMLFGDYANKNHGQLLEPGSYFLEARAYSGKQLSGNLIETVNVAFEVVTNTIFKEDNADTKTNSNIILNQLRDITQGAIRLHPNPATNFIHAEVIDGTAEISKILIYNISGRLVQKYYNTETILQTEGIYKIDTSHLPAGVYLLKAYTNTFSTFHYKLAVKN